VDKDVRNPPDDGGAAGVSDARVTLSTASVYPEKVPSAFEIGARLGYDGIEVMVATDPVSQDIDVLRRLSDYHQIPILSVHAPCLLITQRVWGRDPWGKLQRAQEAAEKLGAEVVVVHPPFRWQRTYAREFEEGLARMQDETDVVFAVENMFPMQARGRQVVAYSPHWSPLELDAPHVTLDLSHSALSGSDALDMADKLGDRLRHIHLADGVGVTNRDEHLVPGRGNQPCAQLLGRLSAADFPGHVVLEVNTRRATHEERIEDLTEALAFTRLYLRRDLPAGATPAWEVAAGGDVGRRAEEDAGR
jgi:sugar phosphate isomerase/epimerase